MAAASSKHTNNQGDAYSAQPLIRPAWPPISRSAAERLQEVYLSGHWSFNSPAEQAFARDFAASHGARHGVFMANGTATLECALRAYGIGKGDEVIVPALTWPATAMAVHYVGATPVFVDIEHDTLCLDPSRVADAITPRTAAIMPVHIYGGMADLERLLALAAKHGLKVIEDCAHMHGAKWAGRGAGTWGGIGSFSFQQSKTMASGEGGICITNDDDLADRIYRAKHIGYADGSVQGAASNGPPSDLLCHNFRSTAFQAVLLSDQLTGLGSRIEQYNSNRDLIESYIRDIPGIRIQSRGRLADPQGYYALAFIFDEEPMAAFDLQVIHQAISREGLLLSKTYGPVYRHVLYTLPPNQYRISDGGCPVADIVAGTRTLTLPHQWLMADQHIIRSI